MKTLYLIGLFALLVVSVTAKRCRKASDCDEDKECCIDKGFFRSGLCKPFAKKGEECNEVGGRIHILSGKYIEHCPCEEGLYCEPEDTEEDGFLNKIFRDLRCTADLTTVRPTRKPATTTTSPTEAPQEE